ncbi:DNA-binding protein [Pseudomonas sp. PDM20]|uniref:DNA-binding protein n=1 Tax=Pseudomonas sp. PDM20 TaxID=2769254 RepID=UPI00177EBDD6|nr:DNA-binding protein [Pseudomonas sp. PDM20]MBD9683831.1 hypothetical protein [Pseudomonas sp. PDM20]MBD9683843.1 hypothetical protein [Pseudomonas sp. PDM20]
MLVKIGLCNGTSEKTSNNGFVEHYVLVVNDEPDQFGQLAQKTTGIRLSKAQLDNGVRDFYDTLKGKQVCVPVYNRMWNNGKGMDTWLSNENGCKPLPLVAQGQLKAAS